MMIASPSAQSATAALAIALLFILLLRIGIFAWNLRRQRAELERK